MATCICYRPSIDTEWTLRPDGMLTALVPMASSSVLDPDDLVSPNPVPELIAWERLVFNFEMDQDRHGIRRPTTSPQQTPLSPISHPAVRSHFVLRSDALTPAVDTNLRSSVTLTLARRHSAIRRQAVPAFGKRCRPGIVLRPSLSIILLPIASTQQCWTSYQRPLGKRIPVTPFTTCLLQHHRSSREFV